MRSSLKEILSQPEVWESILTHSEEEIPWFKDAVNINSGDAVYFIGCGTSYYLAICASSVYSRLTGICSRGFTASDIIFFKESVYQGKHNVRAVTISRSGETTETNWATKHLMNSNIPTFGLTCKKDSTLYNSATISYAVEEAEEKSVVMTRSFTGMLLILQRLAGIHSRDNKFLKELNYLPQEGERIIENVKELITSYANRDDYSSVTFLGQGAYYGLASESMLKLKEMSLTNTEVFHTLEFRHGPKSMTDENSLVILLMSDSAAAQEVKVANELKEQGAKVLVIANKTPKEINNKIDDVIELNTELSEYARLNLVMPITQMFAYHRAEKKGIDPDKPKNLSKIVTIS